VTTTTPGGGSNVVATPVLVEHFFRREYGRLIAVLTRTVGVRHFEVVQDAVQAAMLTALTSWTAQGLPDDPGAWLYRVAYNNLIDELRRKSGRSRILAHAVDQLARESQDVPGFRFSQEVADDTLRMLFVCCDDAIPRESQLVFALKTLCGFSVSEIALRLFTSDANVYKRYARARDRLREMAPELETPPLDALKSRLPAVQAVLYLLFNEGYLSSRDEEAIRRELCDEAVRLTTLLAEHPIGAAPDTFALLALMHLHAARLVRGGTRRAASCCWKSRTAHCGTGTACGLAPSGCSARRLGMCSRGFTPRPASPLSTASRLRSRRRGGKTSLICTRCWSASIRRRCTR
jgi:RNA polymerase sigma factor (sigma-70 family)